MKKVWSTLLVFFVFHTGVYAQFELVEAWIDAEQSATGEISISGNVKNISNEQGDFNYNLNVYTSSRKGTSTNNQSGTLTLLGKEKKVVSNVSIDRVENQQITVELTILLGHIEVAKASYDNSQENKEQTDWSYAAQQDESKPIASLRHPQGYRNQGPKNGVSEVLPLSRTENQSDSSKVRLMILWRKNFKLLELRIPCEQPHLSSRILILPKFSLVTLYNQKPLLSRMFLRLKN